MRACPGVVDAARFDHHEGPRSSTPTANLVQINDDPCASGAGAIDLTTPLDAGLRHRTCNGVRILEGRAADPARADEVVMAPIAAEQFGVEVGDRLFALRLADCCGRAGALGRGIHR